MPDARLDHLTRRILESVRDNQSQPCYFGPGEWTLDVPVDGRFAKSIRWSAVDELVAAGLLTVFEGSPPRLAITHFAEDAMGDG